MSLPFTDKQAREAIAAKLTTAVGAGPKIYPHNCLNYKTDKDGKPDYGQWPKLFAYGASGESIHGWVVKRTARQSEIRVSGCEDFTWSYDVWGFYKFSPDRMESPPGNFFVSDDVFSGIVESVTAEVNSSSLITINGIDVLHYGLQFPVLTVLRAGEQLLHFAGGIIDLEYTT